MSGGFFNKYNGYHNRQSIRMKNHDYSSPGAYFVTGCIHDRRQRLFGNVENGKMAENEMAIIVRAWWNMLPNRFNKIALDEFIIMPNHIHGIIIIRDSSVGAGSSRPLIFQKQAELTKINPDNNHSVICENGRDDRDNIGRDDRAPTTLGMVMGYLKYQSTKQINAYRNIGIKKIWQRNYYDHIIRNDTSLYYIRRYIHNNPAAWETDMNHHLQNELATMHPDNHQNTE